MIKMIVYIDDKMKKNISKDALVFGDFFCIKSRV